jgi:hypothetical protein
MTRKPVKFGCLWRFVRGVLAVGPMHSSEAPCWCEDAQARLQRADLLLRLQLHDGVRFNAIISIPAANIKPLAFSIRVSKGVGELRFRAMGFDYRAESRI